jgi:hypothetical protein
MTLVGKPIFPFWESGSARRCPFDSQLHKSPASQKEFSSSLSF